MKIGVVVFPGSNCDHDAFHAATALAEQQAALIWHESEDLQGADAIIVPGGFSYGDYLRTGALAHFSPVMKAVRRFAQAGNPVLGICNGFQILCESGLLPGVLMRNAGLHYICRPIYLRVESVATPWTQAYTPGQVLRIPIAHNDGNYFADDATLAELERDARVVVRYCGPDGSLADAYNPNGSRAHIAGICNAGRNVVGMMPHPERACENGLGSSDGMGVFHSLLRAFQTVPVTR